MSKLYELTADVMLLQEMLENELDDEQMLLDTLEGVQYEYEYKLEQYAKVIRNLEADANALKMEADRLSNKRRVIENNIDRLKNHMFESMKVTGINKVKGSVLNVSIQKNGGKLPVIVDCDVMDLPESVVKVTKSPDLEAIRKVLDAGECSYARYGERGESLRIK